MQEAGLRAQPAPLKTASPHSNTKTSSFYKLTRPTPFPIRTRPAALSNAFSTSSRFYEHVKPNSENPTSSELDQKLAEDKEKQIRTPWHRDGSDKPPVARQFSAGAMTKGIEDIASTCSCLLANERYRQTPDYTFPLVEARSSPHDT